MKIVNCKLLIISGPTATGKTALAVKIAEKFNGELINADSRQIYKGMDIGTGKDHPGNIPVHLINIITPNQSFSVAEYRKLALQKIAEIHQKIKLPILVGGSGQYIDAVINPQPSFHIPPNKILRFFLNKLTIIHIQKIYHFLDPKSFDLLNNSERHNPHRLIRKIEILIFKFFHFKLIKNFNNHRKNLEIKRHNFAYDHNPVKSDKFQISNFDVLHLSLTAPNEFLYERIDSRVDSRLKLGLFKEIENLLKKYSWHHPGLNTLAYKEFKTGFTDENIQKWRFDEHAYARRQKTWFKKIPDIKIFDITRQSYPQNIYNLINKWYNE